MLNFAEQTGSGAVTVVWSFLTTKVNRNYINTFTIDAHVISLSTKHKINEAKKRRRSQAISHEMHSSQAIFASTVNVDIMAADDA